MAHIPGIGDVHFGDLGTGQGPAETIVYRGGGYTAPKVRRADLILGIVLNDPVPSDEYEVFMFEARETRWYRPEDHSESVEHPKVSERLRSLFERLVKEYDAESVMYAFIPQAVLPEGLDPQRIIVLYLNDAATGTIDPDGFLPTLAQKMARWARRRGFRTR